MNFFKNNSRLISKLFINQIGMTIFGTVLTVAAYMAAKGKGAFLLGVSLFAIAFYLSLVYNVMWDAGARDTIRIDTGRMEKTPFYALRVASFAAIPNFALGLLLLIGFFFGYVLILSFGQLLYGIMRILVPVLQAMYAGTFSFLLKQVPENVEYLVFTLLYLFASLPMILVSVGSYELGRRNIYLFGNKKNKK